MTEEGFLRRWARRKQAAKAAEVEAPPAEAAEVRLPDPSPPPAVPEAGREAEPSAVRGDAPEIAPEPDLPPVESLTAASDFAAFLRQGVSAELQSRALRVAWESDERIAGFRGMAEYAWDFNAPDYGKLWATDDVVKMVREALQGVVTPQAEEAPAPGQVPDGEAPGEGAPDGEPGTAVAGAPVDPAPAVVIEEPVGRDVVAVLPETPASARAPVFASVPEEIAPQTAGMRRHGSALPG